MTFEGYDPYDALLSPLSKPLPKWGRILFTQALLRLPFNPRPLLGIPKTVNPKALGLLLSAAAYLEDRELARSAFETLRGLAHPFGYPFPWQSRAFFLKKGEPNGVVVAFLIHGLLDAKGLIDPKDFLDRLAQLAIERFWRGGWFHYTGFDDYLIHNVNLLLASALWRLGYREEPLRAAEVSVSRQRPDGSWLYGGREGMFGYVDSFHTGFNLMSLRAFGREFSEAYEKGLEFYVNNFVEESGDVRWALGRRYPLDVHAYSVAVGVLAGHPLQRVVWEALKARFVRGKVHFRQYRFYKIKVEYFRWSVAWARWAEAVLKSGARPWGNSQGEAPPSRPAF